MRAAIRGVEPNKGRPGQEHPSNHNQHHIDTPRTTLRRTDAIKRRNGVHVSRTGFSSVPSQAMFVGQ